MVATLNTGSAFFRINVSAGRSLERMKHGSFFSVGVNEIGQQAQPHPSFRSLAQTPKTLGRSQRWHERGLDQWGVALLAVA